MGEEYLGLNGLFTSVLSLLSLTELGIGTSIVYFLYKPLAAKDWEATSALIALYKKVYRYIGLSVLGIGLALLPFLGLIVHSTVSSSEVTQIYLLFLANSVFSYFFTYNRSLLLADQRNYVVVSIDGITKFILQSIQMIVLIYSQNFIIYLSLQVLFTFLGNYVLSILVKKRYPLIRNSNRSISTKTMNRLKKNVVGNFANKIGDVLVNGMDNILLSIFVSVSTVGLYSNYLMIVTAMQTILVTVSSSMTATIGNIAVTEDNGAGLQAFKRHQMWNFTLAFFTGIAFYIGINWFVSVWVGQKYVLSNWVVIVVTINYFINRLRNSGNVFLDAYGLAWEQRFKPFIEGGMNLGLSLLFLDVMHMGITGVVLSTLLTSLGFATFFESYIVFQRGLRQPYTIFLKSYIMYLLSFIVAMVMVTLFQKFVSFGSNILGFVLYVTASVLGSFLIFILFFRNQSELKWFIHMIKK